MIDKVIRPPAAPTGSGQRLSRSKVSRSDDTPSAVSINTPSGLEEIIFITDFAFHLPILDGGATQNTKLTQSHSHAKYFRTVSDLS